jgi:hypothetical protein
VIVPNNPDIDISMLESRITQKAARLFDGPLPINVLISTHRLDRGAAVHQLLDEVRPFLGPRTVVPPHLMDRLPFRWMPFLGRFALRLHEILLRDHRRALTSLEAAVRELNDANRELSATVELLVRHLSVVPAGKSEQGNGPL